MAAVDMGARNNPPARTDDLDDLFDYDVPADILRDVDADMEGPNRLAKAPLGHVGKESVGGLGIDEEIKITRKRAPVAKLDENRLLSQAGIPKLRTITKKSLKFRGKGHEYSDVALLLSVYQLWLDDLYPRAKFADGLAMIEKLGHTKRMQAMRKEWIHEGKPKDDFNEHEHALGVTDRNRTSPQSAQHPPSGDNPAIGRHTLTHEGWSDDELFRPSNALSKASGGPLDESMADSLFLPNTEGGIDVPLVDDLDALLAEDDIKAKSVDLPAQQQKDSIRIGTDNFDDEMEAMAGLDEMW